MFTFISMFHFIHSLFSYCDVREILHNDRNRIPINLHLSILLSCSTVSMWGANDSLVLNPDAKAAKIWMDGWSTMVLKVMLMDGLDGSPRDRCEHLVYEMLVSDMNASMIICFFFSFKSGEKDCQSGIT